MRSHSTSPPSPLWNLFHEVHEAPLFVMEASYSGSTSNQIDARIEVDNSFDDEGYAQSTSTSYVTSLASDIRRGVEENGRLYASYGRYKQMIPMDESEVRYSPTPSCHLMTLSALSAGPQRPPTLQVHPPSKRPTSPLPHQLYAGQNPRPWNWVRYLGPRCCR